MQGQTPHIPSFKTPPNFGEKWPVLKTCTLCSNWKKLWKFTSNLGTFSVPMWKVDFGNWSPFYSYCLLGSMATSFLEIWQLLPNEKHWVLNRQPWIPSKAGSHQDPFSWENLLLIWDTSNADSTWFHAMETGKAKLNSLRFCPLSHGGLLSLGTSDEEDNKGCSEIGKGEVEESVLNELLRGSPILGPRNKVIIYTY